MNTGVSNIDTVSVARALALPLSPPGHACRLHYSSLVTTVQSTLLRLRLHRRSRVQRDKCSVEYVLNVSRRIITTVSTHSQLSMRSESELGIEHEHRIRFYNLGPIEHTQDLDVSCSSLSTIPYSESLVTYVEYEHGVKARLEHEI